VPIIRNILEQFSTLAQSKKPYFIRVLACITLVQAFFLGGLLIRWFWVRAPGHPSILGNRKKTFLFQELSDGRMHHSTLISLTVQNSPESVLENQLLIDISRRDEVRDA
jgi:hypothetical protein